MSLLRQIQESAIDSNTDVASLLRKCKVLAARLGNDEFKQWVERELSGYDRKEDLPDYRVIHVNSKGHFSGAFGSGIRNADIPMICIPKEFRENLEHAYLSVPIAALESLVGKSADGTLQEPWDPSLVAHVGGDIYERMNCMQAWKVIPVAAVVGAIDSVRTRILNFALEIEAADPNAGEAALNSNPIPQERVQQIFNTYVTGDVHNLATGNSGSVSQTVKNIDTNSATLLDKLISTIMESNIPADAKSSMSESIEGMRSTLGSSSFKEHYLKFMGGLADHIQVLGPVIAPFLPALTALIP